MHPLTVRSIRATGTERERTRRRRRGQTGVEAKVDKQTVLNTSCHLFMFLFRPLLPRLPPYPLLPHPFLGLSS